ncbi:MAG: YeeE/YedE family protein [Neomegalonema sp.]|nr:YeeE/YedE family protein [Neomegalonema sp.]
MDWTADAVIAALAGVSTGVLLGLAARRGGFCTLGAVEEALYAHNFDRARMWSLALATAILGVAALQAANLLDPAQSAYAARAWNPLASIVGGLLFGYGMAIAGNCGYGALARLGGGDLRAFVLVIVIGLSAYITRSGPLAPLRLALFPDRPSTGSFSLAQDFTALTGLNPMLPSIVIAAALAAWAMGTPRFRNSRRLVFWSIVVGTAIVAGWAATSWIAQHGFSAAPTASHSFTAPIGETMIYLMTASGGGLSFFVGSVFGVVGGALIGSISKGYFQWEACDDPRELGRQILGAALMGCGGVLAMGCSIGQGMTAFSLLAYSAPITLTAIAVGAALGLRQLISGLAFSK